MLCRLVKLGRQFIICHMKSKLQLYNGERLLLIEDNQGWVYSVYENVFFLCVWFFCFLFWQGIKKCGKQNLRKWTIIVTKAEK